MQPIVLPNGLSLAGEQLDSKRLRLIVSKNDEELVCCKTSRREIDGFLHSNVASLFKGRLQLGKAGDAILVTVKGLDAGVVSIGQLTSIGNQLF